MSSNKFTNQCGVRLERSGVVGEVFEKLTTIGVKFACGVKSYCQVCQCECGQIVVSRVANLRNGHTRSCGCMRAEVMSETFLRHGATETAEYRIWCGIKKRCTNPNSPKFSRYGGRGIAVCERWLSSFESFLEDMGKRPTPSHSVDRRNNNLGYSPENCHWATKTEQANNTRTNRIVEVYGKRRTASEWSRISLVSAGLITLRLRKGWPVKVAVFAQPGDVGTTGLAAYLAGIGTPTVSNIK